MAYSSIPGVLIVRACLCLAIIISGLALRRFGLGLGWPATFVKYGGSILWGAMMLFLVAVAAPRSSRRNVALISAVIAVCVELLRLVHAPWLDAFRLTLAGALLLGRIFSAWDILAYGAGIGLGMLLDFAASALLHRRHLPASALCAKPAAENTRRMN
jgi:Protein of unknown function (DUF2809)